MDQSIEAPPDNLKVSVIKSKYSGLAAVFTILSLTSFLSILWMCSGKNGSFATTLLGMSNSSVGYLFIGLPISVVGIYWGYLLDRKYQILGSVEFLCQEKLIVVELDGQISSIPMDAIERLIFDKASYKGEISFKSVSSAGAGNVISLMLHDSTLIYEVLITSKRDSDLMEQITFYHTTHFRL